MCPIENNSILVHGYDRLCLIIIMILKVINDVIKCCNKIIQAIFITTSWFFLIWIKCLDMSGIYSHGTRMVGLSIFNVK